MKKTILSLLLVVSILTITSCGNGKPREKGTPIAATKEAADAIMANQKENDGKRYSITGHLYFVAPGNTVYTSRPQTVFISTEAEQRGENITFVEMKWEEKGKNCVFIPKDATGDGSTTIFYDNEGNALSNKDKVMVSFDCDASSVYFNKVRIDKIK